MIDPTEAVLSYLVLPLWLAAGVADWLCHRASDIAHTAGPKESLIHLLMFAEVALPLLACLFMEIDALVIAIMIASFLGHELTALWDVSYAVTRREVTPIEQHVHSFLEIMPLMALLLVALLHRSQATALFGWGEEAARFELNWKRPSLPIPYVVAVLTASLFLEILPYLEELVRGIRARHRHTEQENQ